MGVFACGSPHLSKNDPGRTKYPARAGRTCFSAGGRSRFFLLNKFQTDLGHVLRTVTDSRGVLFHVFYPEVGQLKCSLLPYFLGQIATYWNVAYRNVSRSLHLLYTAVAGAGSLDPVLGEKRAEHFWRN